MKVRTGWQALLLATTVAGTVAGKAGVAEAKSVGGCPPGGAFRLVSVEDLGIDPEVATGIPSLDGNQDGLTCIKPLGEEGFIFRDNTVRA